MDSLNIFYTTFTKIHITLPSLPDSGPILPTPNTPSSPLSPPTPSALPLPRCTSTPISPRLCKNPTASTTYSPKSSCTSGSLLPSPESKQNIAEVSVDDVGSIRVDELLEGRSIVHNHNALFHLHFSGQVALFAVIG